MSKPTSHDGDKNGDVLHWVDTAVLILFATLALAIPAVVVLTHFLGVEILPFIRPGTFRTVVGAVLAVVAALVCALNLYLGLIGPWLYKRSGMAEDDADDFGGPSGLPVVGGLLIAAAGALLPASHTVGPILLLLYAIDAYGLPWALVAFAKEGFRV